MTSMYQNSDRKFISRLLACCDCLHASHPIKIRNILLLALDRHPNYKYILDYELFMANTYSNIGDVDWVNRHFDDLSSLNLSRLHDLEGQLVGSTGKKRIFFDKINALSHIILDTDSSHNPDDAEVFHINYEQEAFDKSLIIHVNCFNSPPLPSLACDSHFRYLCQIIETLRINGVGAHIFLHNLPFSGIGWPKGDPYSIDSRFLHDQVSCIFNGILPFDYKSYPQSLTTLGPSLALYEASLPYLLLGHRNRLASIYNKHCLRYKAPIAHMHIGCVTGSYPILQMTTNFSKDNYVFMMCVNNRVRDLPITVKSVVSPNAISSFSNRPISNSSVIHFTKYNLSRTWNQAILRIWKARIGSDLDSSNRHIVIATAQYADFFSSKAVSYLSNVARKRCIITIIGCSNTEYAEQLASQHGFRALAIGYTQHIYELLVALSDHLHNNLLLCIPPSLTGSGDIVTRMLAHGIRFLAMKPHDLQEHLGNETFCDNEMQYKDVLEHWLMSIPHASNSLIGNPQQAIINLEMSNNTKARRMQSLLSL